VSQRTTRIDEANVRALAIGCSILGAGGGGDTAIGVLQARQAIGDAGPVAVLDLDELQDDALVMPCGGIGAPLISIEKLERGDEIDRLIAAVERIRGVSVAALMAGEIGGSNGVVPVAWAARTGLPLVDADGMGRAFPEVPQVAMEVAGIQASPAVITDERGNVVVFEAADGAWLERMERAIAVTFGGQGSSADYLMTAAQARTATVRGSVALAMRIGEAVLGAEHDPVDAVTAAVDGVVLVSGKLVDVERRLTGGFTRGSAAIDGLGAYAGRTIRLEIQNENLVALEGAAVLATVPDVITVLDTATGHAIHTERLRYGQRVTVLAFACDPIWRTPRGLELAGPRAFGYDLDHVPASSLHG
jgi:uncharacterized protein